ncbi:MTH538 TIR-like domain [Nitrosospira sp. Nl5]|uniref:toll/interleukin-1 receptor domain-containing protein n=1 Tax=Nitrosospira sp. Nl5 TaxID=200120 RepID=UPI00088D1D96|nr:toll/interleukin-1 receptor domain-containing protein [Nitrosospira sp. Nl5]SCY62245.1 MTH538 TIR-like domain [Nitrosospira sp. Nl5]
MNFDSSISSKVADTNDRNKAFKYWAFISYSHRDRELASKLHDRLEKYQVPTELVGLKSIDGYLLPKRLYPIFIDRQELPSSSGLTKSIREALSNSQYLLVVCSPNVVDSEWVNKEIHFYKSLGRETKIHCAIVAGELSPSSRISALIPRSLQLEDEPLAVDIRTTNKDRQQEMIRLISGLLGVDFSVLRNRENIRKKNSKIRYVMLTILGLIILTTGMSYLKRERTIEGHKILLSSAGIEPRRNEIIDFGEKVRNAPSHAVIRWQDKSFIKWEESLQHSAILDDVNYAVDIENQHVIVLGRDNQSVIGVYKLPLMHAILGEVDIADEYTFDFEGPIIRMSSSIYVIGLVKQSSSAGGAENAIAVVDPVNKHIGIAWNELEEDKRGEGLLLSPDCMHLGIATQDLKRIKQFTFKFNSNRKLNYVWQTRYPGRWMEFFDVADKGITLACGERILAVVEKNGETK